MNWKNSGAFAGSGEPGTSKFDLPGRTQRGSVSPAPEPSAAEGAPRCPGSVPTPVAPHRGGGASCPGCQPGLDAGRFRRRADGEFGGGGGGEAEGAGGHLQRGAGDGLGAGRVGLRGEDRRQRRARGVLGRHRQRQGEARPGGGARRRPDERHGRLHQARLEPAEGRVRQRGRDLRRSGGRQQRARLPRRPALRGLLDGLPDGGAGFRRKLLRLRGGAPARSPPRRSPRTAATRSTGFN